MRLAFKLAVALSAAVAGLLSGLLWLQYRNDVGYLEGTRDAYFRGAVERAARYCGRSEKEELEARCLETIRFLALMTDPEAFSHALLVDPHSRIRAHSDFLRGESSLHGTVASELAVQAAVGARTSLTQSAGNIRVYSAPVWAGSERTGTFIAAFRVGSSDAGIAAVREAARLRLVQACVLGTAVGILLAAALVAYFLGPLKVIADASRRVAQGDFRSPIPEGREDELGQFAQEFNQMARRLAELEALKESFIAQVTHDLRNPLNAMLFHAELVAGGHRGEAGPKQTESLRVIIENGKALSGLINALLDVTELEAGRVEFDRQPLELRHAVESVGALFSAQADSFGVGLSYEFQPGIEMVCSDADGLRRVLVNLVSNALKFTPAGGRIRLQAYRGAPKEVLIVVADTGVGIPKHRLPLIFAKFAQVPETRDKARIAAGTGLGLFISKRIMEEMGGRIWALSELGHGTQFYLSLPESC